MSKHADLDTLCNAVMDVNENIRSVSIINKQGRAVEERSRDDVPFSKEQNEMFLMQCTLTISMGRDFDEPFGEIKYTYMERKNLSMFSFPIYDNIVLVTSKTSLSSISLARNILATIKKHVFPKEERHTVSGIKSNSIEIAEIC